MDQKEQLESTFTEEYKAAELILKNGMNKPALILYSKSLFALLDYIIFCKYKKLPKNHSERFRILELKDKNKYKLLDELWSKYTDSYSKPSDAEAISQFKDAIKEVSKDEAVGKKAKEIIDRRNN